MSREKSWLGRHRAGSLYPVCAQHQRGRRSTAAIFRYVFLRIGWLAILIGATLALETTIARSEETDFSIYRQAADYCRGNVPRPMALSADKRILCFDGIVDPMQDYSAVNDLQDNGIFVARSRGGDILTAIALADSVRDRRATVVVYNYCFSACASYLAMASTKTFVLKDTLLAWHYTSDPSWCPLLAWPSDDGPKRLEKSPCYKAHDEEDFDKVRRRVNFKFYERRARDRRFEDPPESFAVRRALRRMYEDTGKYPDVMWTWNPRHYSEALIVNIVYEAYPTNQVEVDALVAKFQAGPVLYDP